MKSSTAPSSLPTSESPEESELVDAISLVPLSSPDAGCPRPGSLSSGVVGTASDSASSVRPRFAAKGANLGCFQLALRIRCRQVHDVQQPRGPRLVRPEVITSDVGQHRAIRLQRSCEHVPRVDSHALGALKLMMPQEGS